MSEKANRKGQRVKGTIFGSHLVRRALEEMLTCFYSPTIVVSYLHSDGVSSIQKESVVTMGPLGWKAVIDLTELVASGSATAGLRWQEPNRELDVTLAVPKNTMVYVSSLAPIKTSGIKDLDTGDVELATAGVWVAMEDIPAAVTISSVLNYNVPQAPASAALTGSAGSLKGDMDRTSPTLKWKRLEGVSPCLDV